MLAKDSGKHKKIQKALTKTGIALKCDSVSRFYKNIKTIVLMQIIRS
jgi:hypothetical protein